MQSCNFCEKKSCTRVVKVRAGFLLETFLCKDHKNSFKNSFNILMKSFLSNIKDKEKSNFSESKVIANLNENDCKCDSCGTSAEMLMSTGFPVCKDCLLIFNKANILFFKKENKKSVVEVEESDSNTDANESVVSSGVNLKKEEKKELTKDDKLVENTKNLKRLQERLKKHIQKEEFDQCISLRNEILEIEKENEELTKKHEKSKKILSHTEGDKEEI